jgi:RNA polymerase sigma-70 factor, ECF subfamily
MWAPAPGASGDDSGGERRQLLLSRLSVIPLSNLEALEAATDAELVRHAVVHPDGDGGVVGREADRADEEEICRRFAPRVRLYGLRHLRDQDRALELVQAVLLVLIEAVRGAHIERPEHVDRFVLGTCRNVAARLRDGAARALPVDPAQLEIAGGIPPLEHLDTSALFCCLAKLDPRSRAVVHMCFHDEATAEEIGAHLGTSAGNVRVLRHRAIAQLRLCLDRSGDVDA